MTKKQTVMYLRRKHMDELTIDINQYIQHAEDYEDKNVIYFNVEEFKKDAKEYLQNDNPDYKIVEG
jgi:hypothetical protein